MCFNSILVRLKAQRGITTRTRSGSVFQFHTGSIKSCYRGAGSGNYRKFQFHTGSIKSIDPRRARYAPCFCFNSILVRLKAVTAINGISCLCTFQFHTGSIKRVRKTDAIRVRILFQFHTGSIKRLGESQIYII